MYTKKKRFKPVITRVKLNPEQNKSGLILDICNKSNIIDLCLI